MPPQAALDCRPVSAGQRWQYLQTFGTLREERKLGTKQQRERLAKLAVRFTWGWSTLSACGIVVLIEAVEIAVIMLSIYCVVTAIQKFAAQHPDQLPLHEEASAMCLLR